MKQSQSLLQEDPVFAECTAPKRTEIDKDDVVVWTGLAALSTYFGISFEQAMNRSLNPVIKKIVGEFRTSLQDE